MVIPGVNANVVLVGWNDMRCPDCGMQFDPEHSCYCGYRPSFSAIVALSAPTTKNHLFMKRYANPEPIRKPPEIKEEEAKEALRKYKEAWPQLPKTEYRFGGTTTGRTQSARENETLICRSKDDLTNSD